MRLLCSQSLSATYSACRRCEQSTKVEGHDVDLSMIKVDREELRGIQGSRRRNAVCEWSRDPCHDRTETIVNLPVKRD